MLKEQASNTLQLEKNVPLKNLNTWKVGGNAELVFRASSLESVIVLRKNYPNKKITSIGLGSNVLIRDQGINGIVLLSNPGMNNIEVITDKRKILDKLSLSNQIKDCLFPNILDTEYVIIRAESGVPSPKLAKYCQKNQLNGLSFLAGIPGTIGGALYMNAGAFGGETYTNVLAIESVDTKACVVNLLAKDLEVNYRHVKFPENIIITAGYFVLKKNVTGYDNSNEIKEYLRKRSISQPIGKFSCGSVFKNPKNNYAARLIEECKLKGYKIGGAEVSMKHANFILNTGDATASDIEELIYFVQNKVFQETGISLETELKILG